MSNTMSDQLSPLAGLIAQAAYPDVHPDFTDAGWERMAAAATAYFSETGLKPAEKNPPPPPLDFNGLGWASTEVYQLRSSWFGLAVIEQLHEHTSGTKEWRKCDRVPLHSTSWRPCWTL